MVSAALPGLCFGDSVFVLVPQRAGMAPVRDENEGFLVMGDAPKLSPAVVDSVSLERALQDAEVANLRVIELTQTMLDREARIAQLEQENVELKRLMDPRRKLEHVFRKNHTLYALARQAKRMTGR